MSAPPVQDIPPRPGPNWAALRSELLALIEGYAHDSWTDYNVHDPGVTLGELFAFGVSEAGYVAGLPIADLRAPAEDRPTPPSPDFPAMAVLPCRPLTVSDYRRLLVDLDGVRNAWLASVEGPDPRVFIDCDRAELTLTPDHRPEVRLRGFYQVQVELSGEPEEAEAETILRLASDTLAAHRNLCEVFLGVERVPLDEVGICADLVVAEEADLDELAAQVYLALETFISPPIPFRTLDELLERGLSPEEIFDGPLLRHGFIEEADLAASERKSELRASDLIQVILDIPGIVAVRKLLMTRYREGEAASAGEAWRLPLDASRAARLSLESSRLVFYKRDLPFLVREEDVRRILDELRASTLHEKQAPRPPLLPLPEGRPRRIEAFKTLLNLLPINYGVGLAGLPHGSPTARLAQARQLKGYFLLGELLLSGQRAQLGRLPEILSLWRSGSVVMASPPGQLQDFEAISGGRDPTAFALALQPTIEPEGDRVRRRMALFDHWLARLEEPFDPYVPVSAGRTRQADPERLLADKARLLGALPGLAHDRAAAVNLCVDPSEPGNLSGLERKLHALLGTSLALGNALEIFQVSAPPEIPTWRFRIRDAANAVRLEGVRAFLTREGAESEASTAARNATDSGRYLPETAAGGQFGFLLTDSTGEALARPPANFGSEAARNAAMAASVAYFRTFPPDIELHLLEHILLRPRVGSTRFLPLCDPEPGPGGACPTDDPYTFRATLVLPSWPARFANLFFREYLEGIAREQTPAHVFLKICWLTRAQMDAFRTAWLAWRLDLVAECAGQPNGLPQSQDALIEVWLQLRSQFPVATLHDCADGDDDNPVVLDKSLLGTLQEESPP